MLASDLIKELQEMIETHGDLPVVTGVTRSGYGEAIIDIWHQDETVDSSDNELVCPVFDLVLDDTAFVESKAVD